MTNLNGEYQNLKNDLITILQAMHKKLATAAGSIIVEGYWNIGQRLAQSTAVTAIEQLATDLEMESSTLRRALQFYRAWPDACPSTTHPTLLWSHYKELLTVKNSNRRTLLLEKAHEHRWPIRTLRTQLKKTAAMDSSQTQQSFVAAPLQLTKSTNLCHRYKAVVDRIVDGDTLIVSVDLGFEVWTKKRLRLRGINCAEKNTPEGTAATTFVKDRLPSGTTVAVQTFSTDLHGRYVADVFYAPFETSKEKLFEEGIFLNQQLLDQGLAHPL